jgi:hypothetical protein
MGKIDKKEKTKLVYDRADEMGYEITVPYTYNKNIDKIFLKCLKDDYEWFEIVILYR